MRMLNFAKLFTMASLFAVSMFIFSGCFSPTNIDITNKQQSRQGLAIENYLPKDTLAMITFSTQDKNQREALENIISYFPKNDASNLLETLTAEITPKLKQANINWKEDLAPIFNDNFKVIVGISKNPNKQTFNTYIAFTLANVEKTSALLDKIMTKDNGESLIKKEVFGAKIIDDDDRRIYSAIYKDTLLITNSAKKRDEAVKRIAKKQASILSNEEFKELYKKLPKSHIGMGFVNIKSLFSKLENNEKIQNSAILNAILGEGFALVAEENGLRMDISVAFDQKSKDFNLANYKYEKPYMYRDIPGEKLIMYSESSGLKNIIELQLKALENDKTAKENFEQFKDTIKQSVGLDFDNDILSWMDKGFAFVVQQNKNFIPAISAYIDASSKPRAAKKVLKLIDAGMQQAVESILKNAPKELDVTKIIKKDSVKLGNSNINRVSFDITTLSDETLLEAGLPSGIFIEPLEIYYGLTDKNYFLFSTYTGLDKDYTKTASVAKNPKIKEAQKYIKGYDYQISYISIDELTGYMDNFFGFLQLVNGPISKDVSASFEKVKKYIAPIQYVIAGNKKNNKSIAEGTMFVKISQPANKEITAE